jgi:hypothetical protein
MDEYEVVTDENGRLSRVVVIADFIHIKEGVTCLYERSSRKEQPTIIAAYSNPISITRL